jgi:hypothetical protein
MHHDDNSTRPSYLLMGLIETSELRELLDEVYFYALEPTNEFASTISKNLEEPAWLDLSSFYAQRTSGVPEMDYTESSVSEKTSYRQ